MNDMAKVPLPARERGKVAPEKLAHIVFRTGHAAPMIDWYKTVLEAEEMAASPMATFLTYDDEHHRIAIVEIPGLSKPTKMLAGLEHIAFTYANPEDLFTTYERLKAEKILPYWTINHGATLSFYYRDPDGNQCEFQIDLQDSAAATNEWLAQSDFGTNPIGVKVDPEDIIARYRAGEDPAALFSRPVIEPAQVLAQLPPFASPPEEIDGEWHTTAESPMGERRALLILKARDGILEGRVKGQLHDQSIVRGTWANGAAHWELDVDAPIKGTFVIDVNLIKGQLEGRVQYAPGTTGRFTATRIHAGTEKPE